VKTEQYKIQGMHCASCALNIENKLKKEKGIKLVAVNYTNNNLYIKYDQKQIDLNKIKKIIKDIGYQLIESQKQSNNQEVINLKKRFIYSFFLSLPIIYTSMFEMLGLPLPEFFMKNSIIIQLIFTTVIIFFCFDIWQSGFKKIINLVPNMDSLIFIGTSVAYFYSLINSFLMFLGFKLDNHFYYESAVLILVFISLGKYLESLTKTKTSEAIEKLISLQPKEAIVIKNNQEFKMKIDDLKVGDFILVKPGDKIPVDGIVVEGYSTVDEKMITGEGIPVEKKAGDLVIGGTLNKNGVLKFKATKIGKETMLAQIIKIIDQALNSKTKIQLLVDKISFYFVPTVIFIGFLSFILWLVLGKSIFFALTSLVSVLIIACPCALGLATPTAIMMGAGLAVKNGILIKNIQALESAKKVNVIVFDKTGTLTKGEPEVTDVISLDKNISQRSIIKLSASIEKNSIHPLAEAILKKAKNLRLKITTIKNFRTIPGQGLIAAIKNQSYFLGNRKLMDNNKIDYKLIESKIISYENQGKTVVLLAKNKKIIGLIAIFDNLKSASLKVIKKLKRLGKKVIMITGDNKRVAQVIAKKLNLDGFLAEVLPQEKSKEISDLQSQGSLVAMVGDGINDGPALAQANLGIAIGSGSDIVIETGDLVLIKNDLEDVIKAIDISQFTYDKIKQNLFWAFFYNVISIPVAAGLFYPFFNLILNPAIAALAMAFSSVSVVFNSLLMKKYRFKLI